MSIPKPPGFRTPKAPEPPKPVSKTIDCEETGIMLDRHLLPIHRDDPNVIRFIVNYLDCRSITQAARQSGLTPREGRVLKARRDIHAVIVAITDLAVLKHGYDAAELVERMKEIVEIDPIEIQNPDGTFKESLESIPADTRRAIKRFKCKNSYDFDANGIRVISGKIIEIEFWDKMKAAELLGREKDTFKETKKIEHSVGANMRDILLESRRLANESAEARTIDVTPKDTDE